MRTPREFAAALDQWSAAGGEVPDFRDRSISTTEEAEAICRALSSEHVLASRRLGSPLHSLVSFFQDAEGDQAITCLRDKGLPLLRQILLDQLAVPSVLDEGRAGAISRRDDLLFVLKILSMYYRPGDGALIVQAARDTRLADQYLWSIVFDVIADGHPDAMEICNGLRDPLPDGFVGVAYLDFANALARQDATLKHPFNSDAGIERLYGFLRDEDPDHYSYAVSAAGSIPFIEETTRGALITVADRHPNQKVKMETSWGLAKAGNEFGRQRLAVATLNPRTSASAVRYLTELGLERSIPSKVHSEDFHAIAEMCDWLAHPHEFDRPPDEISQYDSRILFWPPTDDRRRLWLFKFRYDETDRIGLVGSVTFSLTEENLSPEEAYALHCAWELAWHRRWPELPNDAARIAGGMSMLKSKNPGF